jgi:hypothetical protein
LPEYIQIPVTGDKSVAVLRFQVPEDAAAADAVKEYLATPMAQSVLRRMHKLIEPTLLDSYLVHLVGVMETMNPLFAQVMTDVVNNPSGSSDAVVSMMAAMKEDHLQARAFVKEEFRERYDEFVDEFYTALGPNPTPEQFAIISNSMDARFRDLFREIDFD